MGSSDFLALSFAVPTLLPSGHCEAFAVWQKIQRLSNDHGEAFILVSCASGCRDISSRQRRTL
jgi:hypothetical protein